MDWNAKICKTIARTLLVLLCLTGLSIMAASTIAADEPGKQDSVSQQHVDSLGAPVVVGEDTLFEVSSRILSFTPQDRAANIGRKLQQVFADRSISTESVTIHPSEAGYELTAGDLTIMTVTSDDALAAGKEPEALADLILTRVRTAMLAERERSSLSTILRATAYAAATLVGLLVLLWIIRLVFRRIYGRLQGWQGSRIPTLKIQKLELLTAERVTQGLIRLARFIRFVLTVFLLYTATSMILGFFPQTRYISRYLASRLWGLLEPIFVSILNYLPDLVVVIVLVILAHYAIKLIRYFFGAIKAGHITLPGFYVEWADTTFKIARLAVIALVLVLVFPYLPGSESPAFRGVSIFVGLLFSLGSTSLIANMVAGLILTYMRPFKLDDRVKIADTVGDIVEKTILVTRVRTIKNVLITIPNAMVLSSHIINYSSSEGAEPLILHTSVTIGYDAPWRKVHELLVSSAQSTQHILPEPKPFVLQTGLDDFYVKYELNAYTDTPRAMATIYSELHQNIQDKFGEAGVEIMSPHYKAIRDGGMSTIPSDYSGSQPEQSPIHVKIERDNSSQT